MAKLALLIGVNQYQPGLRPLSAPLNNVEALRQVLTEPDIGSYQVRCLHDPPESSIRREIEKLFSRCDRDDLVLLYFSGHGIKDEYGELYFAAADTEKDDRGELIRATAVDAKDVRELMVRSRCRRQVVILDCCFSGAFPATMAAMDDGKVDVQSQLMADETAAPEEFAATSKVPPLGREGRAVLTSSTSLEYSFELDDSTLSIYTRYLVEGLKTGLADSNEDSHISTMGLHEYAQGRVQQETPAMTPQFFAHREGHGIYLAKSKPQDKHFAYRRAVEKNACEGEIPAHIRPTLDALRDGLGLTETVAQQIEQSVLTPGQEFQRKLDQYRQSFTLALAHEQRYPLSDGATEALHQLRGSALGLRDTDVAAVEREAVLALYNDCATAAAIDNSRAKRLELQRLQTQLSLGEADVASVHQQLFTPLRPTRRLALGGVLGLLLLGVALNLLPEPSPQPLVEGEPPPGQWSLSADPMVEIAVPEGEFTYGGSSVWAAAQCGGEGIDQLINTIHPSFRVTGDQSGSRDGVRRLLAGEYDFVISSDAIPGELQQQASVQGLRLQSVPVARDAIAVAVHPALVDNYNLPGLTLGQLARIYSADIPLRWAELVGDEFQGPADLAVVPFSRSVDDSGTVNYFVTKALNLRPQFGDSVEVVGSTYGAGGGIQRTAAEPGGLFFTTATELFGQETVRPLAVGASAETWTLPYTEATFAPNNTCQTEVGGTPTVSPIDLDYPASLVRPIYVVYTEADGDPTVGDVGRAYSELLKTGQGQAWLQQMGFFPID